MTLLGTLLRNSRPDEHHHTWNKANLNAPETLEITSGDFTHKCTLPARHTGPRIRGENISPHLAWSQLPAGTAELLLLIEDIDSPIGTKPAVHCLAVIDPAELRAPHELPADALAKHDLGPGVTLLRSTIGRGYHGPEPLKGHGPHRYVFQFYALSDSILARPDRDTVLKSRPHRLLEAIDSPVLARGRITGVYER